MCCRVYCIYAWHNFVHSFIMDTKCIWLSTHSFHFSHIEMEIFILPCCNIVYPKVYQKHLTNCFHFYLGVRHNFWDHHTSETQAPNSIWGCQIKSNYDFLYSKYLLIKQLASGRDTVCHWIAWLSHNNCTNWIRCFFNVSRNEHRRKKNRRKKKQIRLSKQNLKVRLNQQNIFCTHISEFFFF